MNRKNIFILALSTGAGAIGAVVVCLVFFFFVYKPAQTAENKFEIKEPTPTPTPMPKETEFPMPMTPKVMLSDISSVSINTVYAGFYEANSECGKGLYPDPKPDDTVSRSYSPCRTVLTFNRDGEAVKSVVIRRPSKDGKAELEDKTEWKSKIAVEQFEKLLRVISDDKDFIQWAAGVEMYHSNCAINVTYSGGTLQELSYIDITRPNSMVPTVNAFKDLDKKVEWKKQ